MRRGRERQHSAGCQNLRGCFSECAPDDKRGIRPRQITAGRDQKRHDHVAAFLGPMDRLVFRLQGKHNAVPGVMPAEELQGGEFCRRLLLDGAQQKPIPFAVGRSGAEPLLASLAACEHLQGFVRRERCCREEVLHEGSRLNVAERAPGTLSLNSREPRGRQCGNDRGREHRDARSLPKPQTREISLCAQVRNLGWRNICAQPKRIVLEIGEGEGACERFARSKKRLLSIDGRRRVRLGFGERFSSGTIRRLSPRMVNALG